MVNAATFDPSCVLNVTRETFVVTTAEIGALTIVWTSEGFARLTGYSADEIIGKSLDVLRGPRTDTTVQERLIESLREGKPFEGETWNYGKNGDSFLSRWYVVPIRDNEGFATHFVFVQRDVTADRVVEREDHRMRSSLIPHEKALVVLDRKLRIAIANSEARAMMGPRELGTPFFDTHLSPPDGATRDELMRAIVTQRTHTLEYTVHAPGRDPHIVAVSCSPANHAEGLFRTTIVLDDVTESRRLERIATNVSLSDNIGHAFAGIRHELGNPVNSLKSALTFVRSQLETMPSAQLASYLEAMSAQCDRMDYLLRSLRSFSALDSVALEVVDIDAFIERFERGGLEVVERSGIRFERTVESSGLSVYADPRALYQVLLNLITNAVDACVSVSNPLIGLHVRREASNVVLEVVDNGIGIPESATEKLFVPFYTTKHGGTGLGLSMSERLISRMFGTLEVSSTLGMGSTFTIVLHAEEPSANARRQAVVPSWHP